MADYRSRIAAAWPPEHNAAARTYLAELDRMVASLRATHDAVTANYDTVRSATVAIDMARLRLGMIHAEYAVPSATAARRDQLTYEARGVMVSLSEQLAAATYALVIPPVYVAPRVAGAPSQPTLVPPAIPPASARDLPASARDLPAGAAAGAVARLRSSGATPSTRPAVAPPPTISPPAAPVARVAPLASVTRSPSPVAVRPMPPGGVIGAPPGAGLAQPSEVRSRVNPVGGVYSGHLPVQPQRNVAAPARHVGPTPAYRTSDGHLVSIRAARTRSPDRTAGWVVADGVPPVVEPPPAPRRHDPGPAIGL
jgi:hypothetical protein